MLIQDIGIRISGTVYKIPMNYTLPYDADIDDLLDFEFEVLGNNLEHFDCPRNFRSKPARFCHWVCFVEDKEEALQAQAYDVKDAQLVAKREGGIYLIYVEGEV